MEYPTIHPEKIKTVIGQRVFILWEEAKEDLLNGRLIMPKTLTEKHYTGIILKRGIDVGEEALVEGARIFFEQFSGFEKFQSEDGKKRYAFVDESAIECIIPHRVKVSAEDWAQYGTGDE